MDTHNLALIFELSKSLIESDDSLEEDEADILSLLVIKETYYRIPRMRCQKYVENVVSLYTDEEFQMHFRIKRNTFQFLLELLRPNLCKQSNRFGRKPITPEKQLLVAIWMMATPNSYRCVSDRFDVGKATAWRSVHRVVNALYAKVRMFIRWPTMQEAEQTMQKIEQLYGFPGVIGAIDGTHIKINAPKDNSDSYVNRKGYHSIQLQVICDAQLRFVHCYTGQVGSVHDMRVFRLSNVESLFTDANFPDNSHILGDAAYCIRKHVMVPFKDNGHLSERQLNFNKRLSTARTIVERSLGLLKGRFRSILDTLPMQRTDLIPKYIVACCILHNICLLHNDMIDIPVIVNDNINIAQEAEILENNAAKREGSTKIKSVISNLYIT
ncbi:putative nuclease HARBI1 [Pseudomyrmex gracilis]|uniref:putative nuclease HARBI1 n=1 Tax=Pseudomyrmex gracilis TaxID=219809 RepID=UPI00099516F1|nr:putative nuclease HARBI1 [Pseudomyrmex gracilis]